MTTDTIDTDLKTTLRRLKLGKLLDTLPERLATARQQKITHQDFLVLLLSDEINRRESNATAMRSQRAHLEDEMQIERWDETAKVTFDRALLNELLSLRFLESHTHVVIVGPVGVGKTFFAHAIGHTACRRGYSALALRADKMLKTLKHARQDNTYEQELRKLLSVDLLIVDDFGLDAMDTTESRDAFDILTERHRLGSIVVTSNRGPDEWLPTFADPMRAQAAIDRFTNTAYDLVVDGESYRKRLKPKLASGSQTGQRKPSKRD
jgi:DNA replication protein DnaC